MSFLIVNHFPKENRKAVLLMQGKPVSRLPVLVYTFAPLLTDKHIHSGLQYGCSKFYWQEMIHRQVDGRMGICDRGKGVEREHRNN